MAAKAAPDGYTLLMGMIATHAMSPHLYKNLPYDAIKDFAPVTLAAVSPNVLVVNPSLPVKSVADLIAYAKANPGKLNYGSAGVGSPAHLAGELFKSSANVDIVHVPYKGGAPAVSALLSGEISMMFAGPIESLPHVRSGRLRALAVTTPARFAAAPDLPTMAESGLALDLVQWNGLFAPAGVPPEIIAKLNAEVTRILRLPDVKERLLQAGFEPRATSSREFAAFVTTEYDRWGKVIKSAGVRLE
jgi:tripartite-type tricarboxylate transporter receptor subunit TctC